MTWARKLFVTLLFVFLWVPSFALSQTPPAESFSFVAFGDNRDGDGTYKLLLDKVSKEKNIAFAFNTGDFVSRGRKSEYKKYLNLIKQYPNLKIHHVLGNHDAVFGGWRRFAKYFGPFYYSFDYKNTHFVILNNAFRDSFTEKQIQWLKRDLASSEKTHKIVLFHKPTFDASGFYSDHIMDSRRMAERMMKIFKRYKVNFVICGHIHGFAKAERDGITYLLTGGGGAPLHLPPELGGFYHYVRFDVNGSRVNYKVIHVYD